MTENIFLEIILYSKDFPFEGRDEIEEPLDEALQESNLGEITGGGSGLGSINIDVEVTDLEAGINLIRKILQNISAPESTVINQYEPEEVVYKVYE
ncbi:MAG: hypothetical protein SVR94_16435 [Pseudomonadota bacterium]|nr:hypothetical protein [Pseudomonadota bacterium]